VQRLIRRLLEKEQTECLGRPQCARRAALDAPWECRKGHGQPRRMAMTIGPIAVRRPPGAWPEGAVCQAGAAAVRVADVRGGRAEVVINPLFA
jgi:hypothetical protein